MRIVSYFLLALAVALVGGFATQVIIAQSTERGTAFERVASVFNRQFGGSSAGEASPRAVSAPRERSLPGGLSAEADALVETISERLTSVTREEIASLKSDISRESDERDRASFWTDVKLNTLFLLLGLGAPALLARFMRRAGP